MTEPTAGTASPLRVLLLEDDPLDAELIAARLDEDGPACTLTRVQTESDFRAALVGGGYDVILADYLLPGFDGATALALAVAQCPDVPFLFVSGMIGEERAIDSLRGGATDYVLKHRLDRLGPAVTRAVREARERAERKRLEKELKQRVEQLAQNDRRKNQFLAVLSHELRNPLAPIRYSLPLMKLACATDPETAEACAVVERQVRHLANMVDDLLDVFRIIHNQVRLNRETLNLADVIRQTVNDRRSAIEEGGQSVMVELPAAPVWVDGDATRLVQVVSNLLVNAVKFSPPSGRVAVRLTRDAGRAVVAVRDTGYGIEPEWLPYVFDMFARADDSMTRRQGGLGLGLALVKGFVEQHGGGVAATSAGAGCGSEVSFWLPLAAPRVAPTDTPRSTAAVRRLTLLIIEDNLDAARSLALLLKHAGHDVALAADGPSGLEAARKRCPDVVLCDIGLPDMDGFEVARQLRADSLTASARLIAISGHGQDDDRRRSDEAGFDLHLVKPVEPKEILRLLAVLKLGRD